MTKSSFSLTKRNYPISPVAYKGTLFLRYKKKIERRQCILKFTSRSILVHLEQIEKHELALNTQFLPYKIEF